MPKHAFSGQGNKARRVHRIYAGVENTARKVRAGFVGVNGTARLFFVGGNFEYRGAVTAPTSGFSTAHGITFHDNAVLIGYQYPRSVANVYSPALVRTTPGSLQNNYGGDSGTAALAGDYIVFCGANSGSQGSGAYAEALSADYVRSGVANPGANHASGCTGTTAGNFALFAGGQNGADRSKTVTNISGSLVVGTPLSLTEDTANGTGASIDGKALICGSGYYSTYRDFVNAFSPQLVRSTLSPLSAARGYATVASNREYVFIAGGQTAANGQKFSNVDIYTKDLIKSTGMTLPAAGAFSSTGLAGSNFDNLAVLIGKGFAWAINDQLITISAQATADLTSSIAARAGNYVVVGGLDSSDRPRAYAYTY